MLRLQDNFIDYAFGAGMATEHLPPFGPLRADLTCDVCVVGAGFAGLSSALHIAAFGHEVVLLEENRVGWGASGRNAGMIAPGFATDMAVVRRSLGEEHARELWLLTTEATELVADLIKVYEIECGYKMGHLTAALSDCALTLAHKAATELREAYGYGDFKSVSSTEIRGLIASNRYVGGILDYNAGHLDTLRFVRGLASAARSRGVRIFEQTRVTAIHLNENSVVVTAKAGRVRSRRLVLAANAAIGDLVPQLKMRIFRPYTFMVATDRLGSTGGTLIPDDISVTDTSVVFDYFKMSNDNRLLFGGGLCLYNPGARTIKSLIRQRMLKVFPQLKDSSIEYAWSGVLDLTPNRLPDIGRLGTSAFYAQGFSGHGIALTLLVGKLIAESINGLNRRFDIFARISHKHRLCDLFRVVFSNAIFQTYRQ